MENFNLKQTGVQVQELLDAIPNKADKATTLEGYGITDAYTKAENDALLETKADKSDTYTKEQTDGLLDTKADNGTTLADYGITDAYTKDEVDDLLDEKADKATTLAGYDITDAYTKAEVNNLITTPDQQYVTVEATDQTTSATDVLPATGAANTIYRVGNWDGTQYDQNSYAEYAWDGTQYVLLDTKNVSIATASDFDNPTPAQQAKIPTVGAILGCMDTTPTAGSLKPVQSGGVVSAFRDITKGFAYVSVLSGTATAYSFYDEAFEIPTGATIKNMGNYVNLYVSKSTEADHVSVLAGETVVADKDYHYVRQGNTGGAFKLAICQDSIFSDISSLQSDVTTIQGNITSIGGDITDLYSKNNNLIKIGLLSLDLGDISKNNAKQLPFTIPSGTVLRDFTANETLAPEFSILTNYPSGQGIRKADLPKTLTSDVTNIVLQTAAATNFKLILEPKYDVPEGFSGQNIADNTVGALKLEGDVIKSANLYNKNDVIENFYVYSSDGTLMPNSSYTASNYIEIRPSTYYVGKNIPHHAFYDANKVFISGGSSLATAVQSPATAKYIRVSVTKTNLSTAMLKEGQTIGDYVEFYAIKRAKNLLTDISKEPVINQVTHRFYNGCISDTTASLSNNGTLELTNYPKSLKQGDRMVLYAKITSWGNGITIGKGTTDYTACWLEISATEIIQKAYANGNTSTLHTVSHGLTFQEFVKVEISIDATSWSIIVQTLTGQYTTTLDNPNSNGTPIVNSIGASLTDVVLSCTNKFFASPIWAFGDSYFGVSIQAREMYWLKEWGFLNFLLQGFGGQGSAGAYADLQRCLAISVPKYIVWCLGMNDNTGLSAWQAYVTNIKTFCDANNVELILATVPQPADTTTYKYKDDISDWIRDESDCRYIDVAKAVGSDENGHWYGYGEDYNYQSTDNVHPTAYGAKAIASQFLVDFPEIMQY